jgi:hypothetical protein
MQATREIDRNLLEYLILNHSITRDYETRQKSLLCFAPGTRLGFGIFGQHQKIK